MRDHTVHNRLPGPRCDVAAGCDVPISPSPGYMHVIKTATIPEASGSIGR
jgi:hypothetical protein